MNASFLLGWFRSERHPLTGGRKRKTKLRLETLEDRQLLSCNSISGFVFADANNNGLFDAGETPLANSPIELRNANNVVVGSTQTDSHGHYLFDSDRTLSTIPTTLERSVNFGTSTTDYNKSGSIAKFDTTLGTLNSIEIINDATFTSHIKVENQDAAGATILATVAGTITLSIPGVPNLVGSGSSSQSFQATAFDGTINFSGGSGHDFGDKQANASNSLTLTSAADLAKFTGSGSISVTENAHATSSASGAGNIISQISSNASANVRVVYHYTPNNCLRPGNYTINQTHEPAGFFDGKESRNGSVIPNSIGTDRISVTLGNVDLVHNDFGEVIGTSIGGFVYVDNNNNGIKQSGERAISHVLVTLTGSNDLGQAVALSLHTGSDGSYLFSNLRPGTYNLTESQPANFFDGKDTIGNIRSGSASNDHFSNMVLQSGDNSRNNNFGELLPASIGGCVFLDDNNDGVKDPSELAIPGVAVEIFGTNDLGQAIRLVQNTGADGHYLFAGLRPGIYTVHEFQPVGLIDGKDAIGSLGGTKQNDVFFVAVGMGQDGVNYNFGELLPLPPQVILPPPSKLLLLSSIIHSWGG